MIDYTFRYQPGTPNPRPKPTTPAEAREALMKGNRVFSGWMCHCQDADSAHVDSRHVVECVGLEAGFPNQPGEYPTQKPFAVVLGCSDARVPTEMLFGRGFNDLFVVRVAGNVLDGAVLGSLDFTAMALNDSVQVVVVLGHTNCGAVTGAVSAYLETAKFWSKSNTSSLRLIFERIFVAVRESDNMIREIWGPDAPSRPEYRAALIDAAVCMNAAHTALALRQEYEGKSDWGVEVLYGVYDVRTHQVCMPTRPFDPEMPDLVNLARAPSHPRELEALARELATMLRPNDAAAADHGVARSTSSPS